MLNLADSAITRSRGPIERTPLYIESPPDKLFTWYHSAGTATQLDCVAVICGPIGYEYVHSHRAVRHLADQLALCGIPCLRFDYGGTGDSSGSDLDPDRWTGWQSNILAVIDCAIQRSGCKRVCLIGIHLGATLAVAVANKMPIDLMVLWNISVSGRRYLREIQAIAMTAGQEAVREDGSLECAGFEMSSQTIEELQRVNLLELDFKVNDRVLVLARDDLAPDKTLCNCLADRGIAHDYVVASGYADMMAEPQFTVVPNAAIAMITDWLVPLCKPHAGPPARTRQTELRTSIAVSGVASIPITIQEQCCRYGTDSGLFGILCGPLSLSENLPLIVFFNAGCVHHVGASRLYVALARKLATMGFASFRFDLGGIGDSVVENSRVENHPYPDAAGTDANVTLEFLREQFGRERFILMGLCSGAHTAFHAGLDIERAAIPEIILINPLTFHWVEGMSLETTSRFRNMTHYKGSMRNSASWLKLLRGKANVGAILGTVKSYFITRLNSLHMSAKEVLSPHASTRLSGDLRRLFAMQRRVTLFVAEGDPGRDILMAEARRTAMKAIKSGQMQVNMIPNADHTFSWSPSRAELVGKIAESLVRRYRQDVGTK